MNHKNEINLNEIKRVREEIKFFCESKEFYKSIKIVISYIIVYREVTPLQDYHYVDFLDYGDHGFLIACKNLIGDHFSDLVSFKVNAEDFGVSQICRYHENFTKIKYIISSNNILRDLEKKIFEYESQILHFKKKNIIIKTFFCDDETSFNNLKYYTNMKYEHYENLMSGNYAVININIFLRLLSELKTIQTEGSSLQNSNLEF